MTKIKQETRSILKCLPIELNSFINCTKIKNKLSEHKLPIELKTSQSTKFRYEITIICTSCNVKRGIYNS